jgi:hypothetical protein
MLIGKLLLFAAMLAIAALNRWRLTPALSFGIRDDNPTLAVIALRRSLLAEVVPRSRSSRWLPELWHPGPASTEDEVAGNPDMM